MKNKKRFLIPLFVLLTLFVSAESCNNPHYTHCIVKDGKKVCRDYEYGFGDDMWIADVIGSPKK